MNFDFATANRIIFVPGTARQIGQLASELGKQAMVVTGKDPDWFALQFSPKEPSPLQAPWA